MMDTEFMKKFIPAITLPLASLISPIAAFAADPVAQQNGTGEFDPCASADAASGILGAGCGDTTFGTVFGNLINFIFVAAVIIALGFLIYGGVRWITSGGDKGGVETARNTIISAIVGLVVIVLAYFILNSLVLPFLGIEGGFSGLQITPITGS
ncbi:MAG: hypothetical protein RLZZ455_564 [Candidatus Parcubacteria bacterium]|jgi:hypothetical protein